MFTKNISIGLFIATFAVIAFAAPVVFSNFSVETATVSAFGGGDDDGGGGDDGGCDCGSDPDPQPEPEPEPEPPVCNYLKANGKTGTLTLPYGGGSVNLNWSTSKGTSAVLNGVSVNKNGSKTVNVTSNTTYSLTVNNSDGSRTCVVHVKVNPPVAATCDSFSASPNKFYNGTGGLVTLSWATTNAQSVSISGVGNFSSPDGSTVVNYSVVDATHTVMKTYTLTAIGIGGNDSCTANVYVYPKVEVPKCDYIKANGQTGEISLPYGGGSVDLTWSSSNATGATLTPDGSSVNTSGSKTVSVTSDATYTLNLTNTHGSDSCQVKVKVAEQSMPVCDFLTSNKSSVPYGGGDVTLEWGTTNATDVSINHGVGSVSADGSKVVNVTADKTFVLTATNAKGSDSCQVPVKVLPQEERNLTCQDVSFTASDTSVTPGTSVNLAWVFTGEVGTASLSPNVADPMAVSNVDVTVNNTTTYNMTIANTKNSVACPLTITVTEEPDPITCAANVTFESNDYSLPRGGGDVTLTWTTTGIDSLSINGVSSTNLNDSEVVNVTSDKTYTLQATADGVTINCPISIDVATGGGGSSSPRCDLDISDETIELGEEVTLSWNTSRTDEVRIEDNHGNVIVDTDDEDELDGEITIKPTKDTEYTLTAQRGTRERDCEVEVEVEETVVVYESRSQEPRVAGITLTQVPYTGFEAGPMLTMLFYTLLTLWGLFVAYTVVLRKGSTNVGEVDFVATAEDHITPVMPTPPTAAVSDVPANLPTAESLPKVVGYAQYVDND